MATNTKIVQTPAIALYSPLSAAGVQMIVTPYPVDLDGNKLTMADFGTVGYSTIDPKISGFEEIVSFNAIVDNGNNTATLALTARDLQSKFPYTGVGTGKQHGSSAVVVFSNNPQVMAEYTARANDEVVTGQWTFTTFPITPATPLATAAAAGMTRLSVAPANALIPIAVGVNDTTIFAPITSTIPSGSMMPFSGLTVPSAWLAADGSLQSRAGLSSLFAALSKFQTATITIASPAVITSNAHGLVAGNRIYFTTTGALPSGMTAGTDYYVLATGLTANAFEIAATPAGTAINTTGTQSGVHTLSYMPWGKGDGSTTFQLPDFRGRTFVGSGIGTKVATIFSVTGNVIAVNGLSAANNNEFVTGQSVVFTATTPGNLTNGSTYFIVRTGQTAFSLATNPANAQAGTLITLAGTEAGSFTLTLSTRSTGDTGGEESHSQSLLELALHGHTIQEAGLGSGSGTQAAAGSGNTAGQAPTSNVGSSTPMNIMNPFGASLIIIKT